VSLANRGEARSEDDGDFSPRVQWLLATACAVTVANLYYIQPLTGLISTSLGMPAQTAGLLVTLPLSGYGIGLLTIIPLGDLLENRRLVLTLVGLETLCMLAISSISRPLPFLGVAFLVGATAVAVQVLVPYATYLAPEAKRGQAVGRMVSGVMLGIMLARPFSSLLAHLFSWRAIFKVSAGLMAALFVTLRVALPPRRPAPGLTYGYLLLSLGRIYVTTTLLRRRALYHACMFGSFSVFWTAVPLWLSGKQFGLSQAGIAWVALAGVAGAVAPPIAGRLADRGLTRWGTALAMVAAPLAFLMSELARDGSWRSLGLVVASAVVLDFAVSANLVFGQRAIFALAPELRSRLNGLFMATFFVGGAIGSALGGWAYSRFGWTGASAVGIAFPIVGLLYFATERSKPSGTRTCNAEPP
jgi:predicted MFS family arabinose efflux permease